MLVEGGDPGHLCLIQPGVLYIKPALTEEAEVPQFTSWDDQSA